MNSMMVTEELRQELNEAALATSQAYSTCSPLCPSMPLKLLPIKLT